MTLAQLLDKLKDAEAHYDQPVMVCNGILEEQIVVYVTINNNRIILHF